MKKYFAAVLFCGVLFAARAQELPTGFSLELFGGGTPFFVGDFDWSVDWAKNEEVNGFNSLAFSFGAGLTWFPRDPERAVYGFTAAAALHFPTTLNWTFDGQRYAHKSSGSGNDIWAGEFSLGYIRRLFASPGFIFPVSAGLRLYYLDLKSDQSTDLTAFHKLNLGFNGTFGAEWHFSKYVYLLGHYTASVDILTLASRETRTVTTSKADKTAYYIDDRKEEPHWAFYAAHSFTLGLGFKLDPLFKGFN
jgi:hypothetical protein